MILQCAIFHSIFFDLYNSLQVVSIKIQSCEGGGRSIGSGKRTRRDRERPGRFINGSSMHRLFVRVFHLSAGTSARVTAMARLYFTCLFRLQLITYRVASRPPTHVCTHGILSAYRDTVRLSLICITRSCLQIRERAAASLSLSSKSYEGHAKRIT